MRGSLDARRLVAWTVTGRHGLLGNVVERERGHSADDAHLLVRGGTTDVLYYHVPLMLVTSVDAVRQTIVIDADVADFTTHLRPDGSVDLFFVPSNAELSVPRTTSARAPLSDDEPGDEADRQAADLCGREVVAIDGVSVGSVHDVIADGNRDRQFLVVGTRGFLGFGRHEFLVPADAIQRIDEEGVHIGESGLRISGGPAFHPILILDRTHFDDVCAYYGIGPSRRHATPPATSPSPRSFVGESPHDPDGSAGTPTAALMGQNQTELAESSSSSPHESVRPHP